MKNIVIRKANNGDAGLISDLPKLIMLLHEDNLGQTRESLSEASFEIYELAFAAIEQDAGTKIILATLNDTIVSMAQINFLANLTYQGGKRALIEGVRVDHHFRVQGIGRLLIEYLINLSKQQKHHMVQLTTNKQRQDAIAFCKFLGFDATHEGMKLFLTTSR